MSSNKKNLLKTLLTLNPGCGCGRPTLSDVFEPKAKSNPKATAPSPNRNINALSMNINENEDHGLTSSSSTTSNFSFNNNIDTLSSISTTLNSESEHDLIPRPHSKVMLSPCPKIVDSIAVVKDSDDPYRDFRHSMLQMIREKQLCSKADLQDLLQCLLELNSRCHHDVIVKAFMEICERHLIISGQGQGQISVTEDLCCSCVVHHEGEILGS